MQVKLPRQTLKSIKIEFFLQVEKIPFFCIYIAGLLFEPRVSGHFLKSYRRRNTLEKEKLPAIMAENNTKIRHNSKNSLKENTKIKQHRKSSVNDKSICLNCQAYCDHITSNCPKIKCIVCDEIGHVPKDCPKLGHLPKDCPKNGHLPKNCPQFEIDDSRREKFQHDPSFRRHSVAGPQDYSFICYTVSSFDAKLL